MRLIDADKGLISKIQRKTGCNFITAQEIVDSMPTVEERKKGHWEQYGDFWKEKYRCSECKEEQPKILCGMQIIRYWSDFCPNCGADMRGEEDNCLD